MAKLTLRPWKYVKDKKMRLHWLCSPYRRTDGRWTIRAVFVSAEEEQTLFKDGPATYGISEFPWGLLPNLRLGRLYVNGVLETGDNSETEKLYIPDLQDGAFCSAFQIPKQLYSFFDNRMFGNELIWRFKVDDSIYYLPCMEMIRAFFTPSKTLTNQLLKPHGLESLIEDMETTDDDLHLTLSSDIPKSIVSDEMVAHLLWLTCDETARVSWQKVYNGIFAKAVRNSPTKPLLALAEGLPLETTPPLANQFEMTFTAVRAAKSCLIHEITKIDGLPGIPFTKVKYKHASFVSNIEKDQTKKDSKKIISINRDGRYLHTGERKRVKTMSSQPLAEIPKIILGFARLPTITKQNVFDNPDSPHKEFITEIKKSPLGGNPIIDKANEFSTDESYVGGDVKPIEFAGLTLVRRPEDQGLNDFILTLNHLSKLNPVLAIDFRIYNLPGNSPFCFINNLERRNFAIVRISSKDEAIYLIEISRLDNWQISTLLIKFDARKTTSDEVNRILLLIIKRMIENEGHWVLESLEQATKFRFKRIRHFNDESIESFASVITKQIKLYGIC